MSQQRSDDEPASPNEKRDIWVSVLWGAIACLATGGALLAWWYFGGGA